MKNAETVRRIAKLFGLRLLSFDPNWTFGEIGQGEPMSVLEIVSQGMLSQYDIPDDFMGKVALVMKLPWEFEDETVELEKQLEESKERASVKRTLPKNLKELKSDNQDVIGAIAGIERQLSDLDEELRQYELRRQAAIEFVLDTRKVLREYSTTVDDR